MFAVLVIDFFVLSKGHWDLSVRARSRWNMLVPWAAGFAMYQLINPGYISWWVSAWTWVGRQINFTAYGWMSASLLSFAVAAAMTLVIGGVTKVAARRA
jgi:nucleobase:cation symporter-1, NCS1 family